MSGPRGRPAIALVARREITQRIREKSFLISMGVTVVLVVGVAVIPPLLGFGGTQTYTVAVTDDASLAVAKVADRDAKAFDADINVRRLPPRTRAPRSRAARSTSCCRRAGSRAGGARRRRSSGMLRPPSREVARPRRSSARA